MMFTFKSPINSNNIWTLCFREKHEMNDIFYDESTPEKNVRIYGITDYINQIIYIDKELDGYLLHKTLKHELTHVFLWETGQQDRVMNEEEVCDFMSVAAPFICKCSDDIILRLKEGLYKHG